MREEPPLPLLEEKIYRVVRHMCDLNMEENLYYSIQRQCNQHTESQVQKSFQLHGAEESLEFLVNTRYHDICEQIDIISNLVLYLDQT